MNLALFLPNWIGDVVMATPAIRALKELAGDGKVIGVCRPYVAGVVEGSPWFDKLLFLDRTGPWSHRWPAVAWKLRKEKIDQAVLFPNSFRVALTAQLGNCRRRIGFRRSLRGWLLTDSLEPSRDESGQYKPSPIITDYNRLALSAGCPEPGYRQELFTTSKDEEIADQVLTRLMVAPAQGSSFAPREPFVCLNPGAAFGAAKHWHADSFATLAQELTDLRRCRVLILCGPSERALARDIARLAARTTIHHLADQPLSLGLTKALIRRCDLLVTTDSGPRHFAAAFHRPVLTLFGPTHIAWTETFYDRAQHLQKKVPCGPCQQRVCPVRHHQCMKDLKPEEVFAAACELLDRFPPECYARDRDRSLERRAS